MRILGIRVDKVDMAAALSTIAAAVCAWPQDKKLRQVVTLNPEGLYLALADDTLGWIIENAELVTADGTGILWAAEKLGYPLPERVTGIDLLLQTCALAAQEEWKIYLLGAAPGVAELASAKLVQQYPGLKVAGCHHGYFRGDEELTQRIIDDINAAQPQILFVALGMPAQERFIVSRAEYLQVPVAIGVGGSLDVLAGRVKRAPGFFQRRGLEWLWRLILQPSRLPRMMAIPKFMLLVKRDKQLIAEGKMEDYNKAINNAQCTMHNE